MRYTEEMMLRSSSGYCMPFEEPIKQDVRMSRGLRESRKIRDGRNILPSRHRLLSEPLPAVGGGNGTVSAIGSDAEHGIYQTIRYGKYEVTYRHLSNVFANFSQSVKAGHAPSVATCCTRR